MSHPKVSILIPTYRYARYLPEAIDSVLAQDFTDFELIISDDLSNDNSGSIISRYAAKHPFIHGTVQATRLGMVENWNWCLKQARGEYIKFLFGDDLFPSPISLGKLVSLLDNNPSATLASCARVVIDEHSKTVETWDNFAKPGLHRGADVIRECLEEGVNLIGEPSSVLFRRRDADRGFNTSYRQLVDLEMWFSLLEKGDFVYTREPLGAFRRHPLQQTEANRASDISTGEEVRLYWEFHSRPYLAALRTRDALFRKAYVLKKDLRNNPDRRRLLEDLNREIGPAHYPFCWLRYKIIRPFENLRRALNKQSNT